MKEQNIRILQIFLASSEELKEERDGIKLLEGSLNGKLTPFGLNIHFVLWEDIDSSMKPENKQEEYNKALRNCEMCLVMFWTRFGDYTSEELNIAYQNLCNGNNPRKLYVYFKDVPDEKITEDLKKFRDGFQNTYGHYPNRFQNVETLRTEFLLQFIDYQKSQIVDTNLIEVIDGQVRIGNEVFVNLKDVSFVGKNEEYKLLIKNIERNRMLLSMPNLPDSYREQITIELVGLKDRQRQMENSLWDTAVKITQLGSTLCSERLQRAKDMFMDGNNKGALAILNEEEVCRDINHNLQLIQIGEQGKKDLAINIEELLLRINALKNERAKGWDTEVKRLFERCLTAGRGILPSSKIIEILSAYSFFTQSQGQFPEAEKSYLEVLDLLSHENLTDFKLFMCLLTTRHNLAAIYQCNPNRVNDCYATHNKNLELIQEFLSANPHFTASNPAHQELFVLQAETYNNLALLYSDPKHFAYSEKMFKTAIKIIESMASSSQKFEHILAGTLNNLSVLYFKNNHLDQSEQQQKRALEIRTRLAEINPDIYNADLAISLNNMAGIYLKRRRPNERDECEKLLKKALEIRTQLAKENPLLYEPSVQSTLNNLEILNAWK